MIDLLVAGGGPVGMVTALYAARAGLDVAIAEPRPGPIDKACGEGLMPAAVAALADLGVRPAGLDFAGITYHDAKHAVDAPFTGAPGRGVRRLTLHQALAEAVAAQQIPLIDRRVVDVAQDVDGVRAAGLRARYLVAADGLHSPIARELGLSVAAAGARRWGLRAHVQIPPWTDRVQVHWSDTAEAYLTPVAPDLVGVAVLTGRRAPFAEHLRAFPALADRLAGATWQPVLGAGTLRHRTRARVAGRVLLAGDAAGYVDALTGEGIAVGLAGAREAVRAIASDAPDSYEREWLRVTRTYRALTGGLLWAAQHRLTRRAVVPAAAAAPPVFRAVVRRLGR